MRRMLLVGASALLPACLLFTSLDDASGGADPASEAGADGAAPVTESGANDAPADTTAIDSIAPANDAGFCEQDAGPGQVFCSEFAGTTVADGWTGLAGGVGTLELDQGNMLGKVPVIGQYEQGKFVYRTIDGAFTSLSCSFAFRRDVLGEEDISIAELVIDTADEDFLIAIYTLPTTGRLLSTRYPNDGGDGTGQETPGDLATLPGEWHRVTLEATRTQTKLLVDGQLSATLNEPIPLAPIRTTFRLGLPQIDGDNLQPWELRFDDVRCILTP